MSLIFFESLLLIATHFIDMQTFMSEQLYTVQKILDKRTRSERGTPFIEYKVKWQGYSEDQCTWQPMKNLKYVQELVDEYERCNKKRDEKEKDERGKKDTSNGHMLKASQASKKAEPLFYYEHDEEQEEVKKEPKNEPSSKSKKGKQIQEEQYQMEDIDHSIVDDMENENDEPYKPVKDYQPPQTRKKQQAAVKKQAAPSKKSKQRQMDQQSTTPIQKQFNKKKKPVAQPIQIEESYKSNGKESIHQKIQQIENRIRLESKGKPVVIQKNLTDEPVKILEMARGKDNHYEFLTQQGELLSYRTRDFLFEHYPDELISFYESKINFGQIPKISL